MDGVNSVCPAGAARLEPQARQGGFEEISYHPMHSAVAVGLRGTIKCLPALHRPFVGAPPWAAQEAGKVYVCGIMNEIG